MLSSLAGEWMPSAYDQEQGKDSALSGLQPEKLGKEIGIKSYRKERLKRKKEVWRSHKKTTKTNKQT